jgi:hypothetical protein
MPKQTVVKYPQGFTCVDNRVLTSKTFRSSKPATRLVYLYVARYRDNATGIAFPSQETIAVDAGVSVSTVKRAIAELVANGLLERVPTNKRHNTYRFSYDGVENDRFERPTKPEPAQITIDSGHEFDYPASPAPVTVEAEPIKPAKPKPIVGLPTVDACTVRRGSEAYSHLSPIHQAAARWFDAYAVDVGELPLVPSWPELFGKAKRLVEFCTMHGFEVRDWINAAFSLASEGSICWKDGARGLLIGALMGSYNVVKIRAWLNTPTLADDPDESDNGMFIRSIK